MLVDCCYHEMKNWTYTRTLLEPGRQRQAIEVLDVGNELLELALAGCAHSTSRHDRVAISQWIVGNWGSVVYFGLAESDAKLVCRDKRTSEWGCVTASSRWLARFVGPAYAER
jgi:hypothetical protein